MLELQCTCGWRGEGETKEDLLEQVRIHAQSCEEWAGEPLDDNLLRAVIAQRARPVDPPR